MRLEDCCDVAVLIQFANALCALEYLLGVVSIVAEEHYLVGLQLKVEAAVNALICAHSVFQLLYRASVELCHRHSCHAVLDVYGHRLAKSYVLYAFYRRHEVECYLAVVDADVLCMEVAFAEAVLIYAHPFWHLWFHLQAAVDNQSTAVLDESGVVLETLKIGLLGSVDVQMVGVGACYYRHPRAQPVERAVELIGLDNHIVALLAQYVVRLVVLRDTAEESIAVDVALVHDVSAHCGGCCLAVCTGET